MRGRSHSRFFGSSSFAVTAYMPVESLLFASVPPSPPHRPSYFPPSLPLSPRVSHTPPRPPSPSRRSLVSICRSSPLNGSLGVDGNCQIRNHGRCPGCLTRSEIFPPLRVYPIVRRFRVPENSTVSLNCLEKWQQLFFSPTSRK